MSDNSRWFKDNVTVMGELSLPKQYAVNSIRLDANESPFQTPADIASDLQYLLGNMQLNRYPELLCADLKRKLSLLYDVSPEQILLGNGSSELIHLSLLSIAPSGSKVMIIDPSFFFFGRESLLNDKEPVFFKRSDTFELDKAAFFNAIQDQKPKIIILASPDNPTGLIIDNYFLSQLLKRFKDTMVIMDEVYSDYSGLSSSFILNRYENLIILKSFSKIGFAGIRLGVLISNEKNVFQLSKVKMPYNINSITMGFAGVVVDKFYSVRDQIRKVVRERERIKVFFSRYAEIRVLDSKANFNFIQVGQRSSGEFFKFLQNRDILIKRFSEGNLSDCFRITVGTEIENNYLIDALDCFFEHKQKEIVR